MHQPKPTTTWTETTKLTPFAGTNVVWLEQTFRLSAQTFSHTGTILTCRIYDISRAGMHLWVVRKIAGCDRTAILPRRRRAVPRVNVVRGRGLQSRPRRISLADG